MFREQIKVLDCTIRDGGLMNDHQFSDELVRNVYKAISKSGIDYVELGYKASKTAFSPKQFGAWKFCEEDALRKVTDGIKSNTKLSVMVDIGRVELDDILPKSESVIDMIRVASYVKDIDKAIHLVNHVIDKGYEATVNIMAVTSVIEQDLDEALKQLEKESPVKIVYLVDSFGHMYSEQIQYLIKKYKAFMPSKEIGIHTHNNQQLGFANTIEAIIYGANYLDATLYGIGRGAGNCPMELLIGFLKNPKFDIRPILDIIGKEFIPLREKVEWGYLVPYMITGMLNEHPRSAIQVRNTPEKDDYLTFYKKLINEIEP